MENKVLHGIVGDDQIDPPVAVQVHRRHAERLRHRQAGGLIFDLHTSLRGHVGEMAVPVVTIKPREHSGKVHWPAVGAPDADQPIVHLKINFLGPRDVIADEQVESAVVVIINPRRARAPVVC